MLIKRMNKLILIFMLGVVIPASVFAGSDALWNKLTTIATNGWMEIDSLSRQEMDKLSSLASTGDANAQYALGMIYQAKHEHEKAANWLKQAAEQGHAPARYSFNKNAVGHSDIAVLGW